MIFGVDKSDLLGSVKVALFRLGKYMCMSGLKASPPKVISLSVDHDKKLESISIRFLSFVMQCKHTEKSMNPSQEEVASPL